MASHGLRRADARLRAADVIPRFGEARRSCAKAARNRACRPLGLRTDAERARPQEVAGRGTPRCLRRGFRLTRIASLAVGLEPPLQLPVVTRHPATAVVLTQSESRVEHAARRRHENAAERRLLEPQRLRESPLLQAGPVAPGAPGSAVVFAVPQDPFIFIGVCEFLGGIGLIVPAMTGVKPRLTPFAGVTDTCT